MHSNIILFILVWMFTHPNGNFTKKSRLSCPVRPTTDLRGPPGVPGRSGSKGEVGGEGKKTTKK